MRILLLANPESPRAKLFAAAAARMRPAVSVKVLSWEAFLAPGGRERLADALKDRDVLRLDSPGKNWEVEKALLTRGIDILPQTSSDYARLTPAQMSKIRFEQGRVWPMHQWYQGWVKALDQVSVVLKAIGPRVGVTTPLADIVAMFDKARCHELFAASDVAVPKLLGFAEDLQEIVNARSAGRVFVKPCHGSSASGVVALEWSRHGMQHRTCLEMVARGPGARLYNHRRLSLRTGNWMWPFLMQVAKQRAIVEAWFPKAGFQNRTMDLRVVVIAGRAEHVVVRLAKGPITNLQLGAVRGDPAELRAAMGEEHWAHAMSVAEQAAACFPEALHVGVDLMISPGWKHAVVAEVNAFGDLLPGYLHRGKETYELELEALRERLGA